MENKRLTISVLCATRNNPAGLRTTLGGMDVLASGRNDITYIVAHDTDDVPTHASFSALSAAEIPFRFTVANRRLALGTAWNEAAALKPADVYVLVTDRSQPVTPFWDNYIEDAYSKDDSRVVWWTTNSGPVIPIVPHKWYEAAGNKIYTDYFPFWFDDTWLHEVSALVHGLPNYMIQASCFIYKKTNVTKRLRDLRFWMDFFIAKRGERMEQAEKIREKLGLKQPDMKQIEEWFTHNDKMWDEKWQQWEEAMFDKSSADATYLDAKKQAEIILEAKWGK